MGILAADVERRDGAGEADRAGRDLWPVCIAVSLRYGADCSIVALVELRVSPFGANNLVES